VVFRIRNVSDISCIKKIKNKKNFNNVFFKNGAVYEIAWKNIVELYKP